LGQKYKFTGARKRHFLEVLAASGNVSMAIAAAKISRRIVYDLRNNDETFARAWSDAEDIAADRLETEAWRRAVDGVEEPVISLGKVVQTEDGTPLVIRRYSDNLLLALLRAHRPEKYRDRSSVEVDVSDRLWERLEAARQRALGQPVAAVREVMQLEAVAEKNAGDAGSTEPATRSWAVERGTDE
jgi:hypothetical protein